MSQSTLFTSHESDAFARFVRRIAPWRMVIVVLLAVTGLHALWALRNPWPTSSMTALADTVYGHQPFPSPAATWGVVVLLLGAVATIIGSMRDDLPPLVARLCRIGAIITAAALLLRGVGGEILSIFRLENSTPRYRVFDILLYSPFCIWAALGILYRQPPKAATTEHNATQTEPVAQRASSVAS